MEASDTLHNLWLGCAKDALGSVFLDVAEFHEAFSEATSWDEALSQVLGALHDWCRQVGLECSAVDELSLQKLGVESVSYSFPQGLGKAWANRIGLAWAAHFLKNTTHPELKHHAVMCWAITEYAWTLEQANMWLTDAEAEKAAACGSLFLELHVFLARQALLAGRPRFKVRPRLHSFACETIAKMQSGSRLNPKFTATWSDESFIGQICGLGKSQAIHVASMGLRLLQRVVLNLNAHLAQV